MAAAKERLSQRELVAKLRPFAITYTVVHLPKVLRVLLGKGSPATRLRLIFETLLRPSSSNLKLALFPSLIPIVYQSIKPYIKSKYANEITAVLSSPVALLLPPGLRVYLALYTVSSALATFLKSAKPSDVEAKKASGNNDREWRDYLPPVTVLNALGNSWMVWSWFHEKGVFPRSYEKLILEHSPHYCPPSQPALEIRDFIETTLNPRIENAPLGGHGWLVCKTLHPNEPSCIKNHIIAWMDCAPIAAKWIAGFGALTTMMSYKRKILSKPWTAFLTWLEYVIRGTAYVTGSIQTVWGVTCILQRLFPGNFMPKNRWFINGTLASLWVYALPPKRQSEISIYVGRLGALSLWRAWRKHNGAYIPKGEILILALGWSWLVWLRDEGWKIEGLMSRAVGFVEGREKRREVEEEKVDEKVVQEVERPLNGPKSVASSASIADSGFYDFSSSTEETLKA